MLADHFIPTAHDAELEFEKRYCFPRICAAILGISSFTYPLHHVHKWYNLGTFTTERLLQSAPGFNIL